MTDPQDWPAPLGEERAEQIRAVVMGEITAQTAPSRRRRRRTATVAAVVLGVLVAGAGTATAVLRFAQPDDPNLGYCSPAASVDRSVWEPYAFGAVQAPDGSWEALAGIESCAAMWQAGVVADPQQPDGPAQLFACVIEGALVVMPGDHGVCVRLGVPSALPAKVPSPSAG